MSRWPQKKLRNLAMVQMGQSPPGETYNTQGIGLPFFQGKAEFGEETPRAVKWCSKPLRIAEAGDILLSVRAPVGPTNLASERCCIGRGLAAIRADRSVCNQRYLKYALVNNEARLVSRGVGSTFSAISRNDIESLELSVPPLPEQERIVNLLDEADELRKLRARANRRTAELIPALFHDMFGSPSENRNHWPEVRLVDVTKPKQWPTITQQQLTDRGFPVYGANGVIGFFSDFNHEHETVLVTCRGATCGAINVCAKRSYVTGNAMALDDPNPESLNVAYLEWVLRTRGVSDTITGSAQPQITRQSLMRVTFPLPPLPEQQKFAAYVEEIRKLEADQAASRQRLEALFQSLLHHAFNGAL
jgi:type I restriction enzyme, S subunit